MYNEATPYEALFPGKLLRKFAGYTCANPICRTTVYGVSLNQENILEIMRMSENCNRENGKSSCFRRIKNANYTLQRQHFVRDSFYINQMNFEKRQPYSYS